jgi:hypothetical protein
MFARREDLARKEAKTNKPALRKQLRSLSERCQPRKKSKIVTAVKRAVRRCYALPQNPAPSLLLASAATAATATAAVMLLLLRLLLKRARVHGNILAPPHH